MSACADFLLLTIVVLNLYVLAASRLASCVRASRCRGSLLASCRWRSAHGVRGIWSTWRSCAR